MYIQLILSLISGQLWDKASCHSLHLPQACRTERNVVRDAQGCLHLGKGKTVKRLFARNGAGVERYAKSKRHVILYKLADLELLLSILAWFYHRNYISGCSTPTACSGTRSGMDVLSNCTHLKL